MESTKKAKGDEVGAPSFPISKNIVRASSPLSPAEYASCTDTNVSKW